MIKTEQEIKQEIKEYMDKCGGSYSSWYVGISEDPETRLFTGHSVNKKTDNWIYRTASSSERAREIEAYFVYTLRTDGGPGGGDRDAKAVYAYRKNSHTNP